MIGGPSQQKLGRAWRPHNKPRMRWYPEYGLWLYEPRLWLHMNRICSPREMTWYRLFRTHMNTYNKVH